MDKKEILEQISLNDLWLNLESLCKLDKTSGTNGEFEAVEYLKKQLNEYGIENDIYEYKGYLSYPINAKIEIVSKDNTIVEAKTRAFSGRTGEEGVEGELIYISTDKNMLTNSEFEEYLDTLDLKGKIVINESNGLGKQRNIILAENKGAAGYVHICATQEEVIHEGIATPIWGTPTPEKLDNIPKMPIAAIKNKDGRALVELIKKDKVIIKMFCEIQTGWEEQKLIEARIPGEIDEFLLIGAHVDSWYFGATDNTTSCAVCLELARLLNKHKDKLKRGVRIAWWPGHSTGRYGGSTWYSDNFWMDLHEKCIAYINVDMLGSSGATEYSKITVSAEISDLALNVVNKITGQASKRVRPGRSADQSFWGPGLPYTYIFSNRLKDMKNCGPGSRSPWWWHTEEDTIDKVDKDVLLKDAKIHGLLALSLCMDKVLPMNIKNIALELKGIVEDLDEKSQGLFDLKPVKDELDDLYNVIDSFQYKISSMECQRGVVRFNRGLLKSIKYLTQINYSNAGLFEHTSGILSVPLALLQDAARLPKLKNDPDIEFVKTKLVRNRNHVVYNIRMASKELRMLLED